MDNQLTMGRNYIFLLVFAAVIAFNVSAQNSSGNSNSRDARRKFVFGVKGGFNRSNVYDQASNAVVAGAKTGGVAGAFFCIPFGDFIGFQPEVLFSQKGFIGTGVLNGTPYQLTRTTSHIDVPLQLQLKPFSWFSMVGGIQYSYLLKQRDEFSTSGTYEQLNQQFTNENVRKNLLGIIVGADINFWHIVISGRAGWDVLSNHGDGSSSTPRYKNLWLQGTLGYRIY